MGGSVPVAGGSGLFGGTRERGPYQRRMIGEDFMFDVPRMEDALGWPPTMGKDRTSWRARVFRCGDLECLDGECPPTHRRPSRMGDFRLPKLTS